MFNASAINSQSLAVDPKTKVSVPLAFVIQAEKNADKLTLMEAENASLKVQVATYANSDALHVQKEAALEAKVTSLEQSVKNAEDALALSQKNVGLTVEQKQAYIDRLNEYKGELASTRDELRRANSSKKWWAAGGAVVGYGLAKKF